ncbi:D-alanyl-D-alanine carboxypeptidase family protein [Pseudoroseomonas globiformis]|uniref:D-alanyl-D-alanine carboxypeptidase family protein n=1 Tax=Teichococcus globiformis TaxID=2307229 RepID=A0ABV7FZM9_9PROT
MSKLRSIMDKCLPQAFRRLALVLPICVFMAFSPRTAAGQMLSARYASAVLEAGTGRLLFSSNADEPRHPASLTKMMTLYMVFDALRRGEMRLDQRLAMTETASSKPASKLGLPAGRTITLENAIYAVVTKSANDVASLLGEALGEGSEARFAQLMTLRARAIGMSGTTFRNASGLPDIDQVSTARDMAQLGYRLFTDFPEYYHFFRTRTHAMGGITLRNHNRMLDSFEGVDGIKTGYVDASGFNIVTSAVRRNRRIIAVVFGGRSWHERDRHAAVLLEQGFASIGVGQPPLLLASAVASPIMARAAAPVARPSKGQATALRNLSPRPLSSERRQQSSNDRRSSSPPAVVRRGERKRGG